MTDHGAMQWVGPGWESREYVGPLQDLGFGIPRKFKPGTMREFIYHLAFGYMSGFPVSDILYWSTMVTFFPKASGRLIERSME